MNWLSVRLARTPEARLELIKKAVTDRSEQGTNYLLSVTQDQNSTVRLAAVRALGQVGSLDMCKHLGALLKGEDIELREAVVKSLQEIGAPECCPFLVEALNDSHFGIRAHAATALKKLGWHPSDLKEKASWHVAREDFDAAAREGGEASIDSLAKALDDEHFRDRDKVARALGTIRHPHVTPILIKTLSTSDPALRLGVIAALGSLGDLSAVPFISSLLTNSDVKIRIAVINALSRLPDSAAIDDLIAVLQDPNLAVRKGATDALGLLGDKRVIPALVGKLVDPAHEVRLAAIQSLGKLHDSSAVEGLLATLVDPQASVRHAAESVLNMISPCWKQSAAALAVMPVLKNALQSKDYWIRHPAANLLNQILQAQGIPAPEDVAPLLAKHSMAVDALLEFSGDHDREVRYAVMEALKRVSDVRAVPALKAGLQDSDPFVRRSAGIALEAISIPHASPTAI